MGDPNQGKEDNKEYGEAMRIICVIKINIGDFAIPIRGGVWYNLFRHDFHLYLSTAIWRTKTVGHRGR